MLFTVGRVDSEQLLSSINQQLIAGHFGHQGLRQLCTKRGRNVLQSVVDWYGYVTAHNQFTYTLHTQLFLMFSEQWRKRLIVECSDNATPTDVAHVRTLVTPSAMSHPLTSGKCHLKRWPAGSRWACTSGSGSTPAHHSRTPCCPWSWYPLPDWECAAKSEWGPCSIRVEMRFKMGVRTMHYQSGNEKSFYTGCT